MRENATCVIRILLCASRNFISGNFLLSLFANFKIAIKIEMKNSNFKIHFQLTNLVVIFVFFLNFFLQIYFFHCLCDVIFEYGSF